MKPSNDIKYNKIKTITYELNWLLFNVLYEEGCSTKKYRELREQANTEAWELANKIYDISVDGLQSFGEYTDYPVHWSEVIRKINNVNIDNQYSYCWYIQNSWSDYDYVNS